MSHDREVDAEIRRWLRRHHGIIGLAEARLLGASDKQVYTKAKRGELERIYRGVYRDPAAVVTPYQTLRAAFVATKGRGVVSHASAAWMWGLLPHPPAIAELSIGAGPGDARRMRGVHLHRAVDLDLSRVVQRQTMLVTNPLRTLVDLAGSAPRPTLTAAVDAALASQILTVAGLEAELDRLSRKGRPGLVALRRELSSRGFIGTPHPSVLESKLHRLVRSLEPLGVPWPAVELKVGADGEYRLDLAWAAVRLAIEVDGYVWHFSPEHARRDGARRNQLRRLGWFVQVYTWLEIVREPGRVGREIVSDYRQCRLAAASGSDRVPT